MTVEKLADYLKQHWPKVRETTTKRNLQTATGEAGGDPEAGWRNAQVRHPDGVGSVDPAAGIAGPAAKLGSDLL